MRQLSLLSLFLLLAPLVAQDTAEKFDFDHFRAGIEGAIQRRTLANGLRVILMRNTASPTIACYLKIGVGSANEPFDQAGTAHFLEHLLFKGTKTLGTTNYKKEKPYLEQIEADGERIDAIERILLDPLVPAGEREKMLEKKKALEARLERMERAAKKYVISEEDSQAYSLAGQVGYNAYTTTDVTNYQIKLPSHRLEMWATLESSRFIDPVLREFYPERKVIQEERRMRYDSRPTALLYELYLKTAFGMSPYGKPVIGFEKSMHRLRMGETREFFEKNYIPSRMVITIVGDLEFENAFQIIEKHFGRLKAKKAPEFPPTEYEAQKGRRIAYLAAKNSPSMITGWARPASTDDDDVALEVVSRLLTDGQTSRLVKRLVIEDKLVGSVKVYSTTPGDKLASQFAIFADPFDAKNYPLVEKAIAEEIERLRVEGPTQDELKKIKSRYIAEVARTLSQNAGMADLLSYYELLFGDYHKLFASFEELDKVDSARVKSVIEKYIKEDKNTTVYLKQVAH